jgi:UV DNA damage endonuclease
MGYGRQFQDFKCNVHIGGKQGPEGIKRAFKRLSREAQNTLTIENAEFSWGIDASLELVDTCALVLDVHHHLIFSKEYILPTDARVKRIIDSWRGVRPVMHYSLSKEDVLTNYCDANSLPNVETLMQQGITRSKLRAHSDYYWNHAANKWAASFMPHFDLMLEAKQKNLAVDSFIASIGM